MHVIIDLTSDKCYPKSFKRFDYIATGGSTWLANVRHAKEDAVAVKRLRECGAVMVGKTNMHELGMGTTGINPHYG